jgi:hypothetical protein
MKRKMLRTRRKKEVMKRKKRKKTRDNHRAFSKMAEVIKSKSFVSIQL